MFSLRSKKKCIFARQVGHDISTALITVCCHIPGLIMTVSFILIDNVRVYGNANLSRGLALCLPVLERCKSHDCR